jgi:hypothetical protein
LITKVLLTSDLLGLVSIDKKLLSDLGARAGNSVSRPLIFEQVLVQPSSSWLAQCRDSNKARARKQTRRAIKIKKGLRILFMLSSNCLELVLQFGLQRQFAAYRGRLWNSLQSDRHKPTANPPVPYKPTAIRFDNLADFKRPNNS